MKAEKVIPTRAPRIMTATQYRNRVKNVYVTAIAVAALALFLMPFLYMIFTSLKTTAQMSAQGSPIWPAANPTYVYDGSNARSFTVKVVKTAATVNQTFNLADYKGKTLQIYVVPMKDGSKKNLALLQGFQKSAVFIDPNNTAAEPYVHTGTYFKSLPRPWTFSPSWSNYVETWKDIDFPRIMGNTIFYTVMTTIGVLISCTLVAYGFSRFRFPGRDILFVIMLSTIFLPASVTVIPTFTFWTKVSQWLPAIGVGTWWPLIIPTFFANAYDTFLLRQYFMTLPRELDESAKVDGAGPLRILWSIILPQSYPVLVAVSVFHIVYAWNDYFGPLLYLSTKMQNQPVSVALARFNGIYGQRPELIQAGALMSLLIPLVIFFLAQRFFVQGIVITGVEK